MTGRRGGGSRTGIEGLRRYVEEGVPGTLQVEGDPVGYLVIDPVGKRLAVQVPVHGPTPNCARYENVTATRVRRDEADWNEFSVVAGDRLEDLYPLLCQVLDRVQLEGESFNKAVLDVLRLYRSVWHPVGMSESDQIGLYGELLVLEQVIRTSGGDAAMARWLGPSNEEHDFAFANFDLEVKTTTSERRRHWISSATQLTHTEQRLSWFPFRSPARGNKAEASGVVSDIADQLDYRAAAFLGELERVGYRGVDADLYPRLWTLRTCPAAFSVDEGFPAVHLEALNELVPEISRIVDLRYLVDLTGLTQSTLEDLDGFVGTPEEVE